MVRLSLSLIAAVAACSDEQVDDQPVNAAVAAAVTTSSACGKHGTTCGTGTTIYVGPTGADGTRCPSKTSAQKPVRTIGFALRCAAAGDTIQVAAGTYVENVVIAKNVTVTGAGSTTTTIDGAGTGTVLTIAAGVTTTVSNFSITNGLGAGVATSGALALSNASVTANTGSGIVVDTTGAATITASQVTSNGADGLVVRGATSASGLDVASNQQDGVTIDTDQTVTITDTEVHGGGGDGIVLARAGSGAAITLAGTRPQTDISTSRVHDNAGTGIVIAASAVDPSASVTISTVDVYADQVGVLLDTGNAGTAISMSGDNIYLNAQQGLVFRSAPLMFRDPSAIYADPCDWQLSGTVCENNPVSTLAAPFFAGNRVHGNGLNQILFDGGGTYYVDSPSGSCGSQANAAYCYRNRSIGSDTFAIQASNSATVRVNHFGFAGGGATNLDIVYDVTSLVTVLNSCTATPVCP